MVYGMVYGVWSWPVMSCNACNLLSLFYSLILLLIHGTKQYLGQNFLRLYFSWTQIFADMDFPHGIIEFISYFELHFVYQ